MGLKLNTPPVVTCLECGLEGVNMHKVVRGNVNLCNCPEFIKPHTVLKSVTFGEVTYNGIPKQQYLDLWLKNK